MAALYSLFESTSPERFTIGSVEPDRTFTNGSRRLNYTADRLREEFEEFDASPPVDSVVPDGEQIVLTYGLVGSEQWSEPCDTCVPTLVAYQEVIRQYGPEFTPFEGVEVRVRSSTGPHYRYHVPNWYPYFLSVRA